MSKEPDPFERISFVNKECNFSPKLKIYEGSSRLEKITNVCLMFNAIYMKIFKPVRVQDGGLQCKASWCLHDSISTKSELNEAPDPW